MITTNFMGYKIVKSKSTVSIVKDGICINQTDSLKSAIVHVCDIERIQDRSFIK